MDAKELKPCPFCGSDEVTIGSFGSSYVEPQHYIQCEECGGATVRHACESDAIAAWNRRAALHSDAAQAPPGWKLVPTNPTVGMLRAGEKAMTNAGPLRTATLTWCAMIASALGAAAQGGVVRVDERNAKRYQWLRRRAVMVDYSDEPIRRLTLFKNEGPTGEFLDDWIDGEMAAPSTGDLGVKS